MTRYGEVRVHYEPGEGEPTAVALAADERIVGATRDQGGWRVYIAREVTVVEEVRLPPVGHVQPGDAVLP